MVKEELVTGLRNALARGESLEKAIQSLAFAGYNLEEIQDATHYLNMGISQTIPSASPVIQRPVEIQQKQNLQIQNPAIQPKQTTVQALPQNQAIPPEKKSRKSMIILIMILFLLIAGLISIIFFGDKILSMLFPQ